MIRRVLDDLQAVEENYEEADKPWADVIGASMLVEIVTLVGLAIVAGTACFRRLRRRDINDKGFQKLLHETLIPSFASGALLATTVFLLIPESMELLATGAQAVNDANNAGEGSLRRSLQDVMAANVTTVAQTEHHLHMDEDYHWKFGVAVLAGFLFPILLGALFPPPAVHTAECPVCREREAAEEEKGNLSQAAFSEVGAITNHIHNSNDGDCCGANCCECRNQPTSSGDTTDAAKTVDLECEAGECPHDHAAAQRPDHVEEEMANKPVVAPTSKAHEPSSQQSGINMPLICSILLGDAFHNFTDGIFIGNAFLLCDRTLGYAIVATSIYHELAQEIADFALLTHHCGLSVRTALFCNFLSGLSILAGALMIFSVNLSLSATGSLLAMSAGVYLYIGAAECVPRIQSNRKTPRDTLVFLLCFTSGAVPIGLVLLSHGHCEGQHQ